MSTRGNYNYKEKGLKWSLLKPGTGRDSAGISRPVPATKTRNDGIDGIVAHARASAGKIQYY